jgi:integrase/recombinase XerD
VAVAQASSDAGMIDLWLNTHRSPATRAGYAIDIRALRTFTDLQLAQITVRTLQAFAATLGHLAPATVCRRLSAVKSLWKLAHRLGYLPFDVAAPIPLPAIRDTLSERILTEWDVQRMLALEPKARNAALLRLLYGAGLRISEPCGLRWRDLTPRDDAGQVTILGKGGKTRFILLSAPLWARLIALCGNSGPDSPVFPSRQGGGALSRLQVHRIVKAAARRAGLSAAVSAHFLRHSACSHALDRGCAVHVVQTSLGHASLSTTTRYSHARPNDSITRYLNA